MTWKKCSSYANSKEVGYESMLQTYSFCWVMRLFVIFIVLCLSVFYKFPLKGMHHSCKCILKNIYLKLNFKQSQKDKYYMIKLI